MINNSFWALNLKNIFDIATKHEINCFLDCGTLLGAIREKDFIKWDNDIDLGIIKKNYTHEQLLRFVKEIYKSGYNVNYTSSGIYITLNEEFELNICLYNLVEFYYSTTYVINKENNLFKIFCFDLISGEYFFSNGYSFKFKIKNFLILLKPFVIPILKILRYFGFLNVQKEFKYVKIPKLFFCDFILISFHNSYYLIPKEFEKYLNHKYGDWKTPNPIYNYLEDDKSITS
jgi:phosphorylcholine metabolism protein LicD